jgi:hypothetical protein
MTGTGFSILNSKEIGALVPPKFEAVIWAVKVPASFGVPERVPFEVPKLTPGGNPLA